MLLLHIAAYSSAVIIALSRVILYVVCSCCFGNSTEDRSFESRLGQQKCDISVWIFIRSSERKISFEWINRLRVNMTLLRSRVYASTTSLYKAKGESMHGIIDEGRHPWAAGLSPSRCAYCYCMCRYIAVLCMQASSTYNNNVWS